MASAQVSASVVYPRNLTVGDQGPDVSTLQLFLVSHGFMPISGHDGYFGQSTAIALANWQKSVGIKNTGYFGPASRAVIMGFPVPATAAAKATSPSLTTNVSKSSQSTAVAQQPLSSMFSTPITATASTFARDLTIGSRGSDVIALQLFLIQGKFLAITTPTGYFGSLTATAVAKWQASVGIKNTGYFGSLSRATMTTAIAAQNTVFPATAIVSGQPSTPATTFSGGGGGGGGGGSFIPQALAATMPAPSAPATTATSGGGGGGGGGGAPQPAPTPSAQPTSNPPATPAAATPSPASNAGSLNYKFGISVGDSLPGLSSSDLNKEFDTMVALGIGWVRLDFSWPDIQPNNAKDFNWANIDRIVGAANAHNLKLLPILDYSPAWAATPGCTPGNNQCPPADKNAFATFAAAAAARYTSQGVTKWEIWNEPNLSGFWAPAPNAADYSALLHAAYNAIKSQNPTAGVISGGLSPAATTNTSISPIDFLTQMYADGVKPYLDAVGDHPYSYPVSPLYTQSWNAWSQMGTNDLSLRSVMTANGDGAKQIWMTEMGAPTGGPGALADVNALNLTHSPDHVSEAMQSQILSDAVNYVKQTSWAGPLFWYSYKDLGTSNGSIENSFGLLRADGSQKPAFQTFHQLITQ